MITTIMDLITDGVNVLVDRDLLKVTTIKKKFLEQMATMEYGHFCDIAKAGEIAHIGRTPAFVILKNGHSFYKLQNVDWLEWRAYKYIDGPTNKVHSSALHDYHILPQLFED